MTSRRRANEPTRWLSLYRALPLILLTLCCAWACDPLNSSIDAEGSDPAAAVQRGGGPDLPEAVIEDKKASAQHLLIQFKGSTRAPADLTRTQDEARKLAEELSGKAMAEGADFSALIREHSEEPNAQQTGGVVGVFRRGEMVPPFEEAVFQLEEGQISDVVETVFGFHVIQRLAVEEIRVSHILIQYKGSQSAPPSVNRGKEKALVIAGQVQALAAEPGSDFVDLARQYSDCPSAAAGGDLGTFGRGVMVPAFEEAAFAIGVEAISEVVETPFGYHVIKRGS